MNDCW